MDATNDQLVLVAGESGSGKSASLRNIRNQEKWVYLNCEAGKRLPFRNKFISVTITDPYEIFDYFQQAMENPDKIDGIIIDTITFLMEMFESIYINRAADTQKAWGAYFQFFKELMQEKVAAFGKPVVILGHTLTTYDQKSLSNKVSVPVKGALKNNGIEAYFSTVVATKKIELSDLAKFDQNLLTITPEDEALGYKHVFQTQLTKSTTGERIRSPMGMFRQDQTFMDNDVQKLLDHLDEYYGVAA
jgi:hypothetical protein